ncbi:hypothetical protein [Oryza sativa Japonica Group]|uniref:Uncharacterized protein n=1 Tax=Oryza sativa subsp. japonica TaxID=39947 RepID=Q5JKD0_ORYSJ|nr:hypothetical protein [Oryza sativa Japonica Group]
MARAGARSRRMGGGVDAAGRHVYDDDNRIATGSVRGCGNLQPPSKRRRPTLTVVTVIVVIFMSYCPHHGRRRLPELPSTLRSSSSPSLDRPAVAVDLTAAAIVATFAFTSAARVRSRGQWFGSTWFS